MTPHERAMNAPIFIASDKDGGIDDSERAMLRACHLSGQMEADKAVDHYRAGELPLGITEEPEEPDFAIPLWVIVLLIVFVLFIAGYVVGKFWR